MRCAALHRNTRQCDKPAIAAVTEPNHNVWFAACREHLGHDPRSHGWKVVTLRKKR